MKLKEKLQSNRKYISNENLYETLICVIVFEKGKIIERERERERERGKREEEITWFKRGGERGCLSGGLLQGKYLKGRINQTSISSMVVCFQ